MGVYAWFCKHKWIRICSVKVLKRRTLKEFTNAYKITIPSTKYLEYEVLSETFVCEKCGEMKHFVS